MGKISNYQTDTPNPGDKILASDAETNATKNLTAQSIADLGRSSSVYRAFLTQTGTNAPVATLVTGNTITGTWSYNTVGTYTFTVTSGALGSHTALLFSPSGDGDTQLGYGVIPPNIISLISKASGSLGNDLMGDTFVEITTYDL